MTKQEIKDNYAIKHNFSSWKELYLSFYWVDNYEGFLVHENAVIDLIQDHLLHKVYNDFDSCEDIGQIINVEPI